MLILTMRLLCLKNGEFYIILVEDYGKTRVGLKKNRTIRFGKVRLKINSQMVSEHIPIPTEEHMVDNRKMVLEKVRGLGLYLMGVNFLENGKIIEDGTENQLIKKEMKSEIL